MSHLYSYGPHMHLKLFCFGLNCMFPLRFSCSYFQNFLCSSCVCALKKCLLSFFFFLVHLAFLCNNPVKISQAIENQIESQPICLPQSALFIDTFLPTFSHNSHFCWKVSITLVSDTSFYFCHFNTNSYQRSFKNWQVDWRHPWHLKGWQSTKSTQTQLEQEPLNKTEINVTLLSLATLCL